MANYYKIYYHDSEKNQTLKAIQGAYALGDRPMVLFIGCPEEEKLAEAWEKLATAKFKKYLKENEMVCLKVEDSEKHCKSLVRGAKKFINPDGSKLDGRILLIKPNMVLAPSDFEVVFKLGKNLSSCNEFICGSTKKMAVDAQSVIAWLEAAKELEKFKEVFTPLAEQA